MPLTARQQLVLAEAVAEIDTPLPGQGDVGPRWDGLVLSIRNRLAARHRTALATGFDKPGPMFSEQQVAQILTQVRRRATVGRDLPPFFQRRQAGRRDATSGTTRSRIP